MDFKNQVFPFFFVISKELKLVEIGRSFKKLYPSFILDLDFNLMFNITRPAISGSSYENIIKACGSVCIITPLDETLPSLYGQLIIQEDKSLIFIGNPEVHSLDEIEHSGLNFNDFAIHDSINDTLIMLQTQATSLKDLHELTSKLKRKQIKLKEAKEYAEEASKSKTRFLSNTSHEIRTPMNGVVGVLEILKKRITTKKETELIDLGIESARSLIQILNDVLDVSKIEADELIIEHISFNLHKSLLYCVQSQELGASDKNIKIEVNIEDNVPKFITSDQTRYKQIINNLISNALKFSNSDTVIIVNLSYKDKFIYTSVKDSGIGIQEKNLEKIFNPYKQADDSTTRKYGGTGLGLALVKKLTALLGGGIAVESEYKKGSLFTFHIKYNHGEEHLDDEDNTFNVLSESLRALVVDNHETDLKITCLHLEKAGIKFAMANSGIEALEVLKHEKYDFILMDCNMPGMDGFETSKCIRESKSDYKDIPIIALSVLKKNEIHSFYEEAKMNGYLQKPLNIDHLKKLIEPETTQKYEILVVDDIKTNQIVIGLFLAEHEFNVSFAFNGKEAIEQLNKKSFDLILMDYHMPIMDGFEATQVIRKRKTADSRIPIVALTSDAFEEAKELCTKAGMDDFLTKPLENHKMLSVLRHYCRKS